MRRPAAGPKRLLMFHKSRHMRRWLLRNPWIKPMCVFNYAAVQIQKLCRAFLARKRLKQPMASKPKHFTGKKVASKQLDRYLRYLDDIKKGLRGKVDWLNGGFSAWCAVKIQAQWRMALYRKNFCQRKFLTNQVAAIVLQTFWRDLHGGHTEVQVTNQQNTVDLAQVGASRIQRLWRSFCCRRIYRYFRDLINIKLRAAPVDLLRTIVPQEAHSLDRASGVHVRFRLGGRMFPPKLFFKVYTHRPLCDVNAFAPRCYAKERPMDVMLTNNHGSKLRVRRGLGAVKVGVRYFDTIVRTTCLDGTDSWYRRDDHNDWRAVASQLVSKIAPSPWFLDAAQATGSERARPFHFDRLRRKQSVLEARKRRKRVWMKKIYSLSRLEVDEDAQEKPHRDAAAAKGEIGWRGGLVDGARAESKELRREAKGAKSDDPETHDVDLVKWSLALDFDAYAEQWGNAGVSLPSDLMLSSGGGLRRK